MPAFDANPWIGNRTIRPTAAQFADMAAKDTGLYNCAMDKLWRNAGYFALHLAISTAIDNNAKDSLGHPARFPYKVVAADVGVESAAGTTCVADVQRAPAATPTVFATMLTATKDVKTGAGTMQAASMLDGNTDVAHGDLVRLEVTGGGSGAVVGGRAVLHCFRL